MGGHNQEDGYRWEIRNQEEGCRWVIITMGLDVGGRS